MMNDVVNKYYLVINGLKKSLGEVFFYLHVKIYVIFSVILNTSLWLGARAIVSLAGEDQIALHYNVDAGIDYYGQASGVYVLPFLGLTILLVNFLLFWAVARSRDRKFISHLLLSNVLVVNVILVVAMYSNYLVNFR